MSQVYTSSSSMNSTLFASSEVLRQARQVWAIQSSINCFPRYVAHRSRLSLVHRSVTQLALAQMDGVDQLNNILIIGMTNRKDLIDEALLRAGRLEVHVEISLPDEAGRLQILNIHTTSMRQGGLMDSDVDLQELAAQTKNFSGAEIRGLVNSASSFAFTRHVKVGTSAGISDDVNQLKVNRKDFQHALEEVKPLFGVSEEELSQVVQNGIMRFSPTIDVGFRTSSKIRLTPY